MKMQMPIAAVETQEFLFAANLSRQFESDSFGVEKQQSLERNMRVCFRLQRFAVMNWLMMNGVSIPFELLSDQSHPDVGFQFPDTSQKADRVLRSAE